MLRLITLSICICCFASFHTPPPVSDDYDIETIYKGELPAKGTMALIGSDDLKEVKVILVPDDDLDNGNYEVTVSKKASNLYKVDDRELYIQTRSCYESAYSRKAVLKITGTGWSKGRLLFVKGKPGY